mmetsp:Transcript_39293/g.77290  ORF Transcript_39293/g.77290 Transcript_39293/m.77290 type:complete len:319 (+) Transcript_39293:30-986(+)
MRSVFLGVFLGVVVASGDFPFVVLNDGVELPIVAQGTDSFNNTDVAIAIAAAVKAGFVAVDTAFNYGNQVGVGNGIREAIRQSGGKIQRENLFLITKVPPCIHPAQPARNITDPSKCYQQTKDDVAANFNQLGLAYIDLLLLHGPNHHGDGACLDLANALNLAQWTALQELKSAKKVRSIGVSNYCPSCLSPLWAAATTKPTVNQIAFHVGSGADPDGIVSWCRQHDVSVQAYSPLANGNLSHSSLLNKIGEKYSKSWAQVALKWIVQQGHTLAAKSENPTYLKEDIDIFDWDLSEADMATLTGQTQPAEPASWGCSQ